MGRIAAWTVKEAAAELSRTGVPVTEAQLAGLIRFLPGFPREGETPSGPAGGRGKALYPIADLMRLHGALGPWLADDPGQSRTAGDTPASDVVS